MLEELIRQHVIGGLRIPLLRRRPSLALLTTFVAISAARAAALVAAGWGERTHGVVRKPVFEQMTGAFTVWLAVPIVLWFVLATPNPRGGWGRFIATHVVGCLVFSVVQVTLMLGLRAGLARLFGYSGVLRALRFQFGWEMQQDFPVYGALAALLTLLVAWEERRVVSLNAAKLDARFASARLAALAAQVDPHFLFNALNTASQEMFADPRLAERLLADLGEILRATIGREGVSWTLGEERAHTQRYAGILEARFGERLELDLQPIAGLEAVAVPRFSVQSLVDNAVKHNADRVEPLRISVGFLPDGERVRVCVQDDGRGFDPARDPRGRGMDRLAEILELLHGGEAGLQRTCAAGGGARVEFWVPRRQKP